MGVLSFYRWGGGGGKGEVKEGKKKESPHFVGKKGDNRDSKKKGGGGGTAGVWGKETSEHLLNFLVNRQFSWESSHHSKGESSHRSTRRKGWQYSRGKRRGGVLKQRGGGEFAYGCRLHPRGGGRTS